VAETRAPLGRLEPDGGWSVYEYRKKHIKANLLKIKSLRDQGFTWAEIHRGMGMAITTLTNYKRLMAGTDTPYVDPRTQRNLAPPKTEITDPEVLACLEDSPEGFRRFYDRYSPYSPDTKHPGLQPHSVELVTAAYDGATWKDQIVLTVPPRHAKSEVFSIWFPIWRFAKDRNTRIILLSKTHDLALDFLKHIARHLEYNEKLTEDFGRFKPGEGEGEWAPGSGHLDIAGRDQQKERSLRARGSGQQIYGMAADWLIADDVVTLDNSRTVRARDELDDWFKQEALTRVEDEGRCITVGTRFFHDDLYGRLISATTGEEDEDEEPEALWEHISFPSLQDPITGQASTAPDAVPLWPSKWTRKKLMRKRDSLGSRLFNATYQQQPIASEDQWFRREWLEDCRNFERGIGEAKWPREQVVRVVHYDPGITGFGVIFISDIPRPAEVYEIAPIDWIRRRGLGPEDAHNILEQWQVDYGPINFFIPEKNSWNWFDKHPVREWCHRKGIRILKHHTGFNKIAVELGLRSLEVEFEFQRVDLPYKDDGGNSRRKTSAFIDELALVPDGRYDDQAMAFWLPKPHFKELYRRPMERTLNGWQRTVPAELKGRKWIRPIREVGGIR
jgi:hypothetical protein